MILLVSTLFLLCSSYVQPAPDDINFQTCPDDLEVLRGMSASFDCEAMVSNNNVDINISWFQRSDNNSQIQLINVNDPRIAITSNSQSNGKGVFSTFTLSNVSILDAATYLCIANAGSADETKSATLTVLMSTTQQQHPFTTSKTESESLSPNSQGIYSQSWSVAGSISSTVASFPSRLAQSSSQAQNPSSIIHETSTQTVHLSQTIISSIAPTTTLSSSTFTAVSIQSSELLNTNFFRSATLIANRPDTHFTDNPTIVSITPFIVSTPSSHTSSLGRTTNKLSTSTLGANTIKSVSSFLLFATSVSSRILSSPKLASSQFVSQSTQTTVLQSNSVLTVPNISPFILASPTYSTSQSVVNTNELITTKLTFSKISSGDTHSIVCASSVVVSPIDSTLVNDNSYYVATPALQSKVSTFSVKHNVNTQDHLATTFPVATPRANHSPCPPGEDAVWRIYWPSTDRDMFCLTNCSHSFSGMNSITGQAKRYCSSSGEWEKPDVSSCQNKKYTNILLQVSAFSNFTMSQIAGQVTMVVSHLAALSVANNASLLPSSLDAANQILVAILDALENVQNISIDTVKFFADILDQLLDSKNSDGWMILQSDMNNAGSRILLSIVERVGELLARAQGNTELNEPIQIFRPNIAMSAKEYKDLTDINSNALNFPEQLSSAARMESAQIQLPLSLVKEKLSQPKTGAVPVVFMLIQNIASFLPSIVPGLERAQGASVVLTAQVGPRNSSKLSRALQATPVSLEFRLEDYIENISGHHCVFWSFSNPIGNGSWSTDGLKTKQVKSNESATNVQCTSTHLTSFAVLVSVGGIKQSTALQAISYIGCSISILCLLLTIIFFLSQWRDLLNTKVHYFIHLNLALSLFLAYLVFVVGIETARSSQGGCALVAALLHYLFLAAFCWMLCEGIMIYLLLVLVFGQLKNKWWFFLLLGYLPPLIIVVISVAARWNDYGVKDGDGNIQFCWLSTNNGTIAAFIAPMLVIILINVVFMALALRVIWKSKTGLIKKVASSNKEKKLPSLELVKSLLTAAFVLLPILGLTWVFGVLAVNENSEFFAWIFTILNSLQGVFILIFHVIKTDKVLKKIKTFLHIKKNSGTATVGPQGTRYINSDSGTLKSTLSYTGTIQRNLGSQDFDSSKEEYEFEKKSLDSLTD